MVDFSFGEVEAVISSLNDIARHKRAAFISRLKHLQKNGLPRRDRPGRGRAGTFTFDQLMQVAVGVELIQSGLPPSLAARIVTNSWTVLRFTICTATWTELEQAETPDIPTDWVWLFTPEALTDLTREGATEYHHTQTVKPLPLIELQAHLMSERPGSPSRRTLIIHGSELARSVVALVAWHFRFATVQQMQDDFAEEISFIARQSSKYAAQFKAGEEPVIADPIMRLEVARRLGIEIEIDDTPLRPPVPPAVTRAKALELTDRLSNSELRLAATIFHGDSITISEINRADLNNLTEHDVIDLEVIGPSKANVKVTPFGKAVGVAAREKLGGCDVDPQA